MLPAYALSGIEPSAKGSRQPFRCGGLEHLCRFGEALEVDFTQLHESHVWCRRLGHALAHEDLPSACPSCDPRGEVHRPAEVVPAVGHHGTGGHADVAGGRPAFGTCCTISNENASASPETWHTTSRGPDWASATHPAAPARAPHRRRATKRAPRSNVARRANRQGARRAGRAPHALGAHSPGGRTQ